MTYEAFNTIIDKTIERCKSVLQFKSAEYATDDRLHNFKVAAGLQKTTVRKALAGMMAKHTVSIYDMCRSGKAYEPELWDEKIGDSINYLLLLRAAVQEEQDGNNKL